MWPRTHVATYGCVCSSIGRGIVLILGVSCCSEDPVCQHARDVQVLIAKKLADADAQIAQGKAKAMANVGNLAAETAAAVVAKLLGSEALRGGAAGAHPTRRGIGAVEG